jgi:hypothetical protein
MILGATVQKLWVFEVFRWTLGRAGMCWNQPTRVDHLCKKWRARQKKKKNLKGASQPCPVFFEFFYFFEAPSYITFLNKAVVTILYCRKDLKRYLRTIPGSHLNSVWVCEGLPLAWSPNIVQHPPKVSSVVPRLDCSWRLPWFGLIWLTLDKLIVNTTVTYVFFSHRVSQRQNFAPLAHRIMGRAKVPPLRCSRMLCTLWSIFYWKFGEWARAWVHNTPIFSSFPLHLEVSNLPFLIEFGEFTFFEILFFLNLEYT